MKIRFTHKIRKILRERLDLKCLDLARAAGCIVVGTTVNIHSDIQESEWKERWIAFLADLGIEKADHIQQLRPPDRKWIHINMPLSSPCDDCYSLRIPRDIAEKLLILV